MSGRFDKNCVRGRGRGEGMKKQKYGEVGETKKGGRGNSRTVGGPIGQQQPASSGCRPDQERRNAVRQSYEKVAREIVTTSPGKDAKASETSKLTLLPACCRKELAAKEQQAPHSA